MPTGLEYTRGNFGFGVRVPASTLSQTGAGMRPGQTETAPRTDSQFTTMAQGTGDALRTGGTLDNGTLLGAEPRLNVLARDTHTGRVVRLENVKVQTTPGVALGGIEPAGNYTLQCDNYEVFQRRETERMLLVPAPRTPVIQNSALPDPVRVTDTIGTFGNTPSPICRAFNSAEQEATRRLGMLTTRSDLHVVQGPRDGRSPGIVISQTTGQVSIFDNSGSQHITMDGRQVRMQAGIINTGQALEGRNHFGFPAMKNPVNDYVPQGTILTPQPRLIPNIMEMANMVLTVVDIVDMIRICGDVIQVMRQDMSSNERDAALEELKKEGEQTRWEREAQQAQREADQQDRVTGNTQGARGITEVR